MSKRPGWREPLKRRPKGTPKNFTLLEERRKPFGQNGAKRCGTKARSTGDRCRNPAVTGSNACRVHGGLRWALRKAQEADSRVKPFVSDQQARKRYDCSVAFLEDLPKNMTERVPEEGVGARGRRIAAALKRELNR